MITPETRVELRGWMEQYTAQLLTVAGAFAVGPLEAEDLVQETWVVALQKAPYRNPDAPIGAWLHQVCLNIGLADRRRRKRREGLMERWKGVTKEVEGRSKSLEEEQARALIWRAIAELPSLQKEVLLMRVVEGLSTEEAAVRLGRAQGTVKASLHRALNRLRGQFGDGEFNILGEALRSHGVSNS
jgi:RNA polymerase sigma factor (sigma-70 family)